MSTKLQQTISPEDQFGKKIDRCVTDSIVKAGECNTLLLCQLYKRMELYIYVDIEFFFPGGGLFIGSVLSLVFFKRRAFPIYLGTGFGIGVGYRNCELALNANKSK